MATNNRESLRKALRQAKQLGCEIRPIRKTGELRVTGPGWRMKINGRRKDCPLRLAVNLKRLEREAS